MNNFVRQDNSNLSSLSTELPRNFDDPIGGGITHHSLYACDENNWVATRTQIAYF